MAWGLWGKGRLFSQGGGHDVGGGVIPKAALRGAACAGAVGA